MNTFVVQFTPRWFLIGVALMLSLAGCSNVPITIETSTPLSASATLSLTPPTRVTPSGTSIPSQSVGMFSPAAVTISPTRAPTATPTPLAPLTGEEARAFVIHMQETNGGCELPCWWGITPGKTTGQQAEQILSPLRRLGSGDMVGMTYIYSLDPHVYANLGFDVLVVTKISNNQPVDKVSVESFTTVIDDTVRYDKSWRRYFVKELLTQLGQPSEVWLGFGPYGPQGNERYFYELMVFYENLGLTIEYAGPAVKGNLNRACPTFEQLKLLRLNIQNPSDPKMARPPGPGEPFTDLRPISEATNLTPEKFYNSIKDAKGQVCMESPARYWP